MAAYFTVPRTPERLSEPPTMASLAADLGLEVEDIGFDAHEPVVMGAGTANLFVPLKSLAAMGRARPDRKHWGENGGPCLYLYTRQSVHAGSDFHARMFAAGWGVYEDPATGSAAAAFAGVMMAFEKPRDGEHVVTIEQGVEMGRPSFISVGLDVEDGVLRSATIGGSAVIVATLTYPVNGATNVDVTVPMQWTAVAGAQVTHPVRLLAEHRHQIALPLVVGDDHRERNRPPRLVATYFKRGSLIGPDAGRKDDGAQPVCDARRPPRTAPAILPSLEPAYNAAKHASTLVAGV